MRVVTIELNSEVVKMLEFWRKQRLNKLIRRIDESPDEKVKEAFRANYEVMKTADYDYLVEIYLRYEVFFGDWNGSDQHED